MNVTLLGPQRTVAAARAAVAELIPDGPVVTVNAGWQEREADTAELDEVLGGRMANLELYRRWRDVLVADPDYAAAERQLSEVLTEVQAVYAIRLQHALAAVDAISRRRELASVQEAALADAIRTVRELDAWHLGVVAEARAEFYGRVGIGERDSIAGHRAELDALVAGSAGMVVAGGHVGVLLHLLHIFAVARLLRPPLIAWSAGAMALSDRVVLYHDHTPAGPRPAELYAEGIGAYAGVLPFPHARRRLRMDDAGHLAVLARRLRPRTCLLLADGVRVDLSEGAPLPAGARRLAGDGSVELVDGHG